MKRGKFKAFLPGFASIPVIIFIASLICLFILPIFPGNGVVFGSHHLNQNKVDDHLAEAFSRIKAWTSLVSCSSDSPEIEKLQKVNRFFNNMRFMEDSELWNVEDYWATPLEFLVASKGDCEDFALAKFFTLKAMGVEEHKLYMTCAKTICPRKAHMVVTYYSSPDNVPLVLDNLTDDIEFLNKRRDLLPVYGFNSSSLCLMNTQGLKHAVGKSDRLKRWHDVQLRVNRDCPRFLSNRLLTASNQALP